MNRDIPSPEAFEQLMKRSGISNDTTMILYGDNNNWFAAYALWLMKYYGHDDVRLMNGGRQKWLSEGREITIGEPQHMPGRYMINGINKDLRSLRPFI